MQSAVELADSPLENSKDTRLYFWASRTEGAFLQSLVDAHDNLARMRTERHDGDRSLIVLMYSSTQDAEVRDMLQHYKRESGQELNFV